MAYDNFKNGPATINVPGYGTAMKTFGHRVVQSDCGTCYLIKPISTPNANNQCGNFGTCTITSPDYILMMGVGPANDNPEIGNAAFENGLSFYNHDGRCNDLVDGKWPFEYKILTGHPEIGCP